MSFPSAHEITSPVYGDRQALAVFGERRMGEIIGHEATLETTTKLIDTVTSLCAETNGINYSSSEIQLRSLETGHGLPLILQTNPEGAPGFGSTKADLGVVSVAHSGHGSFRAGLSLKKITYDEMLFVDSEDRVAKVLRRVWGKSPTPTSAIKMATETELQAVMNRMISSVASEQPVGTH